MRAVVLRNRDTTASSSSFADSSDSNNSLPTHAVSRLKGHVGPVHVVRYTADGKYCLTGGQDRTVRLWNPTRIDPAASASSSEFPSSESISSSPDDNRPKEEEHEVVSAVSFEELPPALPIQTYSTQHMHPVSTLHVDRSSTSLYSAADKALVLTDVVSGHIKRRLHGHTSRINAIASSEETFLSGSYDGTVRIYDGRSRDHRPIQILSEARDSITSLSVDGTEILTGSVDGVIRTYDVRTGSLTEDALGKDDSTVPITSFALSRDSKCLLVAGLFGAIYLLEKSTGQFLNYYAGDHKAGRYALECGLAADDSYVVTGSEDGDVVLYDFVNGSVGRRLRAHSRPTCSVAAHPSACGDMISAGYDGNAIVWADNHRVRFE